MRGLATEDREIALVPLSGRVRIEVEGTTYELGRRRSVFDGRGECLYVPRDATVGMRALTKAEFAICGSRCTERHAVVHVEADDVPVEVRGAGNATRQIATLIPPDFPAERLLVVEVWTPGGNWSSFPPHKHDELCNDEAVLEETYYYRTANPAGFGLQRLYSPSRNFDASWTVFDGDLLAVPWGYHTTCAAHGHDLYYLNVLAGPGSRTLQAHIDPDLAATRDEWTNMRLDERVPTVPGTGSL
jgi:5-deoxy-glucuronate isomerase